MKRKTTTEEDLRQIAKKNTEQKNWLIKNAQALIDRTDEILECDLTSDDNIQVKKLIRTTQFEDFYFVLNSHKRSKIISECPESHWKTELTANVDQGPSFSSITAKAFFIHYEAVLNELLDKMKKQNKENEEVIAKLTARLFGE